MHKYLVYFLLGLPNTFGEYDETPGYTGQMLQVLNNSINNNSFLFLTPGMWGIKVNINNNHENVCSVFIMTTVIAIVHPVHLMNID